MDIHENEQIHISFSEGGGGFENKILIIKGVYNEETEKVIIQDEIESIYEAYKNGYAVFLDVDYPDEFDESLSRSYLTDVYKSDGQITIYFSKIFAFDEIRLFSVYAELIVFTGESKEGIIRGVTMYDMPNIYASSIGKYLKVANDMKIEWADVQPASSSIRLELTIHPSLTRGTYAGATLQELVAAAENGTPVTFEYSTGGAPYHVYTAFLDSDGVFANVTFKEFDTNTFVNIQFLQNEEFTITKQTFITE